MRNTNYVHVNETPMKQYHRVPITPDRPIEDNYLDAYVSVMKRVDPLRTPIVFNCGMGAVRTTYAMVAACLIRRKQYMSLGMRDPFLRQGRTPPPSLAATPGGLQAILALEQAEEQKEHNESLLKLAYLLQKCAYILLPSPLIYQG